MNDKKIADYDPSLDMLNQNRSDMDKNPDWAQAAETNPTMRVAQAAEPRKLTGEEYLQRKVEEALSPRAAEVNPAMRAADPDEGIHRSR